MLDYSGFYICPVPSQSLINAVKSCSVYDIQQEVYMKARKIECRIGLEGSWVLVIKTFLLYYYSDFSNM
jgi:hypothetical protein